MKNSRTEEDGIIIIVANLMYTHSVRNLVHRVDSSSSSSRVVGYVVVTAAAASKLSVRVRQHRTDSLHSDPLYEQQQFPYRRTKLGVHTLRTRLTVSQIPQQHDHFSSKQAAQRVLGLRRGAQRPVTNQESFQKNESVPKEALCKHWNPCLCTVGTVVIMKPLFARNFSELSIIIAARAVPWKRCTFTVGEGTQCVLGT